MLMQRKFWYIWIVLEIIIIPGMFLLYFLVEHPTKVPKSEGGIIVGSKIINTNDVLYEKIPIGYYDIFYTEYGYIIVEVGCIVDNTAYSWVTTTVSKENKKKYPERYFESEEELLLMINLCYNTLGRFNGSYCPILYELKDEIEVQDINY